MLTQLLGKVFAQFFLTIFLDIFVTSSCFPHKWSLWIDWCYVFRRSQTRFVLSRRTSAQTSCWKINFLSVGLRTMRSVYTDKILWTNKYTLLLDVVSTTSTLRCCRHRCLIASSLSDGVATYRRALTQTSIQFSTKFLQLLQHGHMKLKVHSCCYRPIHTVC